MADLVSQGKTYTYADGATHASYPDTGGTELTDGAISSDTNYLEPEGALYTATVGAIIDLGKLYNLAYVRFHHEAWGSGSAQAAKSLTVYGSNDGVNFSTFGTFNQSGNWTASMSPVIEWSGNLVVSGNYRYVKFSFVHADSYGTYICLDELQVYGSLPLSGSSAEVFDDVGGCL